MPRSSESHTHNTTLVRARLLPCGSPVPAPPEAQEVYGKAPPCPHCTAAGGPRMRALSPVANMATTSALVGVIRPLLLPRHFTPQTGLSYTQVAVFKHLPTPIKVHNLTYTWQHVSLKESDSLWLGQPGQPASAPPGPTWPVHLPWPLNALPASQDAYTVILTILKCSPRCTHAQLL